MKSRNFNLRPKRILRCKRNIFQKSLIYTFYEYVDNTKVNGLWLLRRNYTSKLERYFWGSILLGLLLFGISLSILLWNKFYSLPTLVTIENQYPATSVELPAITLCSPLTIVEEKLKNFLGKINIPNNFSREDANAALRSLDVFTHQQTTSNETRYEIADLILQQNNLSVHDTLQAITPKCEDLIQFCYMGSIQFPCYEERKSGYFKNSLTTSGFCCSFNMHGGNQSNFPSPFRVNSFGVNGGLVIVGTDRIMGNQSAGLVLKVHYPLDYAIEAKTFITLVPYSETFVVIYPIVLSSSNQVIDLSTSKRDCRVPSDYSKTTKYKYRQAACILYCQHEFIARTCGCHPYNYPITIKMKLRDCLARDAGCFAKNYYAFKNIKCTECFPNCYDVTYTTTSDYTGLLQHNISASRIYSSDELNANSFIVRVYLAKQFVSSHHKILIMPLISLLADLGGVFNLCLGISIISVFEFIYFFTFRLYANYKSEAAMNCLRKK